MAHTSLWRPPGSIAWRTPQNSSSSSSSSSPSVSGTMHRRPPSSKRPIRTARPSLAHMRLPAPSPSLSIIELSDERWQMRRNVYGGNTGFIHRPARRAAAVPAVWQWWESCIHVGTRWFMTIEYERLSFRIVASRSGPLIFLSPIFSCKFPAASSFRKENKSGLLS